ncbi:hypothetical protein I7I51_06908 [Histoplasma capsulatum]|uniref:Uncharacterized protein n=1 Tax=Ajellomyces capsulatus TaxID=5037 RepID=A0A8A1MPR0_AJECA|nr:hypothetical protein I7I51_06908 [Histoplasma capsulatum]
MGTVRKLILDQQQILNAQAKPLNLKRLAPSQNSSTNIHGPHRLNLSI